MEEFADEVYVYNYVYKRDHLVYNDLLIEASNRLMSLAFRAMSSGAKRSSLKSKSYIVYRLPLGHPYDGICSDIMVGRSLNVDYDRMIFNIISEDSYRIDRETGEEVVLDDFYFTGTLTLVPEDEIVELCLVRREANARKPKPVHEILRELKAFYIMPS